MTPARLSTFALLASVVLLASSSGVSARRLKSSGDDDGDNWTSLGAVSCMDDDGENIETHRDIDSLADCEGKCDQSERCNAVTYNSDGKDCYLKAACHDQEMRNNNDESAVKGSEHGDGSSDSTASESEDSSESEDYDAGNWETLGDVSCMDDSGANEKTYRHIDSLADCEAKCEEHDEDCKAVTYNSDSKDCYLKATCYDKEERDNGDESAQLKDVKFCWGKNGNAPKVFGVTHDHVCCVAAPAGEDGWECCQNDYDCDGSCYNLTTKDGYQKGEPTC